MSPVVHYKDQQSQDVNVLHGFLVSESSRKTIFTQTLDRANLYSHRGDRVWSVNSESLPPWPMGLILQLIQGDSTYMNPLYATDKGTCSLLLRTDTAMGLAKYHMIHVV